MIWKIKDGQIEYGNRVLIMGIVNVTPDSFSDGGDNFDVQNAVSTIFKMIDDGADIIDIGAQSTRPDHTPISSDEEWARLGPVLSAVKGKVGVPISIDTYYPQVAEKSLKTGANIINDVSGVISPKMAEIVKFHGSGWVLMHNGSGTVDEVKNFFINSVDICKSLGVNLSQICFDMGIGLSLIHI